MYNPIDVANWFLAAIDRDAGDSVTHLKLQKLVYYAQAWTLVLLEEELFAEDFQAWVHGPVLPSLYHAFSKYGWQALPEPMDALFEFKEDVRQVLIDVYETYGGLHAKRLEELTHQEPPWRNARVGLSPEQNSNRIIRKEDMAAYYTTLLEDNNGKEIQQRSAALRS